jgi:hypothetical protein
MVVVAEPPFWGRAVLQPARRRTNAPTSAMVRIALNVFERVKTATVS